MTNGSSPFTAILSGQEPGNIVAQDNDRRLALIECKEPEAAIHWLAVPFEYEFGTEELEQKHQQRFIDLVDFAITQTKTLIPEYPLLQHGFTVKFHVGAFETVPHAKLHILSTE